MSIQSIFRHIVFFIQKSFEFWTLKCYHIFIIEVCTSKRFMQLSWTCLTTRLERLQKKDSIKYAF